MKDIYLYYAKIADYEAESVVQKWLPQMEERRRKQLLSVNNPKVRARSLAAGVSLRLALGEKLGLSDTEPLQIKYGEAGKPYLADYPDMHFNLSHSGAYVCCGISNAPVGVDIQQYQEMKARIAERFFTEQDNQMLQELEQVSGRYEEWKRLFFRIWSIREGYLKLTGSGLSRDLDSFEIDWEQGAIWEREVGKAAPAAWFWSGERFDGYSVCVCSKEKELRVEEKEIGGKGY